MIEILADWPLTTIGAEFDIQQGKSLSPSARLGEKPRPFLRTSNVYWGRVDLAVVDQMDFTDEEFRRLSLVDGDLLVCEGGDIGRSAVYRGPSGRYAYQNHLHRLRPKNDEIVPEFVAHWLRAAFTQLGIYEGVGNRTTIPNLSRARLSQLPIPKPEPTEQRQIALILNSVQKAIETESAICGKLAALKSATMAKLFREGLRGEPLKQTEIGEIPESWEVSSLGQLSSENGGCIQTGPFGSQLHARDYRAEGVPVINPTHLEGNRINHESVPRVDLAEAQRLDRHRVEVGDILFGRRGEIGRHGLVSQAETGWLCGTGCFLVRVRSPRVDNAFLSYFFSTVEVMKWLVSHAAGTIMPNLNNVVLSALPVVLPEISEQRGIVNLLDVIDKNLAIHSRKNALLKALFQILLSQLMTGAIRVKDLDLAEVGHA